MYWGHLSKSIRINICHPPRRLYGAHLWICWNWFTQFPINEHSDQYFTLAGQLCHKHPCTSIGTGFEIFFRSFFSRTLVLLGMGTYVVKGFNTAFSKFPWECHMDLKPDLSVPPGSALFLDHCFMPIANSSQPNAKTLGRVSVWPCVASCVYRLFSNYNSWCLHVTEVLPQKC